MLDSVASVGNDSLASSARGQPHTCKLTQGPWTADEHDRFLSAMTLFPRGPWSSVAAYIGTRTTRQTMTHAQKDELRRARHARGLRPPGRVAGPNARRRQRRTTPPRDALEASRSRPSVSCAGEPVSDEALTLLFAPPLLSCERDDAVGRLCVARTLSPAGGDELLSPVDWLDDFLRSVDVSEFEPCAVV